MQKLSIGIRRFDNRNVETKQEWFCVCDCPKPESEEVLTRKLESIGAEKISFYAADESKNSGVLQ